MAPGSTPASWELLLRYSNFPELLDPLEAVVRRAATDEQINYDATSEHDGGKPAVPWRLRERLSETQVQELIIAYRAGATIREVAERYGFGTTTIKRLLRQRMGRRCDDEKSA